MSLSSSSRGREEGAAAGGGGGGGAAGAEREVEPSAALLSAAAHMSMYDEDDVLVPYYDRKDIHFDYWGRIPGMSLVINEETKTNVLAKSDVEFTSPIQRTKKVGDREIIVETENSIYIVLASQIKVCKQRKAAAGGGATGEPAAKKKK